MEVIYNILKRTYGDVNPKQTARTKLHQLKQTNKEFESFLGEFQRLAVKSETSEDHLRDILLDNISKELKNRVFFIIPIPIDYHNLVELLRTLDYQARSIGSLYNFYPRTNVHIGSNAPRALSHTTVPVPKVSVTTTVPSTASGTHLGLMNILGSVRRVSLEKRERRHRLGLYHYCGEEGYIAFKCTKKGRRLYIAEVYVPPESTASPIQDIDAFSQVSNTGNFQSLEKVASRDQVRD